MFVDLFAKSAFNGFTCYICFPCYIIISKIFIWRSIKNVFIDEDISLNYIGCPWSIGSVSSIDEANVISSSLIVRYLFTNG